ncbi:hypothetical protein BC830DRAFT_1082830 [Chytriomyces sp. MP71]|nr:hypothetical protein BC830DRAFT_1082830 [Chytriomyces sp. MP71]
MQVNLAAVLLFLLHSATLTSAIPVHRQEPLLSAASTSPQYAAITLCQSLAIFPRSPLSQPALPFAGGYMWHLESHQYTKSVGTGLLGVEILRDNTPAGYDSAFSLDACAAMALDGAQCRDVGMETLGLEVHQETTFGEWVFEGEGGWAFGCRYLWDWWAFISTRLLVALGGPRL